MCGSHGYTWRLVSLLFDDLSGHSYPFTFLIFLNLSTVLRIIKFALYFNTVLLQNKLNSNLVIKLLAALKLIRQQLFHINWLYSLKLVILFLGLQCKLLDTCLGSI